MAGDLSPSPIHMVRHPKSVSLRRVQEMAIHNLKQVGNIIMVQISIEVDQEMVSMIMHKMLEGLLQEMYMCYKLCSQSVS